MNRAAILVTILACSLAAAAGALAGQHREAAPNEPASAQHTWPQYQDGPTHNAVLPGDLAVSWTSALGAKTNGGLAVDGDMLYADSFDHLLYALDLRTGKIRWRADAGSVVMSTPVIADGIVVVGTGKNGWLHPNDPASQIWGRAQGDDVIAYDAATGRLRWRYHTVGEDMPSPAIVDGRVIFANGDDHAYALDLRTGTLRWKTALRGTVAMASMTAADGRVFTSTCHNAPYFCNTIAIDPADGHIIWVNEHGGSDCSPTVAGGMVFTNENVQDDVHYHTGGTDTVAAIDERDGKTRWTWTSDPGPYTFPNSNERQIAGTYAGGVLYQPIGQDSRIVAFDARTGRVRWNLRTWADVKMSPLVTGGRVYFGDQDGVLYNVVAEDGHLEHTSSFLQAFTVSPPVIVGKTIVFADSNVIVAMEYRDV